MMEQFKQPAAEQTRQSHHQQNEQKTPPSLEEIRRQLGWHLCNTSVKSHSSE
jgi:hypothetical protein